MIDFAQEKPITLASAAATLPGKSAAGTICYHTLYRWAVKGQCGIRLETACIGNYRYTSLEAIQRFIRSLTAVRDDIVAPIRDHRHRVVSGRCSRARREEGLQRLQRDHGLTID